MLKIAIVALHNIAKKLFFHSLEGIVVKNNQFIQYLFHGFTRHDIEEIIYKLDKIEY